MTDANRSDAAPGREGGGRPDAVAVGDSQSREHGPRPDGAAAIDRDDARLERIQRVYTFVPLGLYDEYQKLSEIAVREFIEERDRYRAALDALLADTLVLMDQHVSAEVQMEARRRIIERHGTVLS